MIFNIIAYTLALYPIVLIMIDYNKYVEREIKKISNGMNS